MKSKSYIFLFVLVFMIVFSLSAVSADDLQTTNSGEVSGDVDVVATNPWATSGELKYDIPAEADIKSADVYVNVFAGSSVNTYGAIANVSLKTTDGENQIASEELWTEHESANGTVYPINDHTDKCVADYQMRYDITDSLKGLNGSSIAIKVDTFQMPDKTFDAKISLIALVLAYDDGDDNVISYWVDSSQRWTMTNVTTTFDTTGIERFSTADLTNIALSTLDGNFTVNGESLGAPDKHSSGNHYQYSNWDVSDEIKAGSKTEVLSANTGNNLTNVLTVLTIGSIGTDILISTEYSNTCYAGTNNTLTLNVNSNKKGRYEVELQIENITINSTFVDLDGEIGDTVLLTDPTIRPINETTVNGADNEKVTYVVNLKLDGVIVGSENITVPVLYNGNLGSDMEYDTEGLGELCFVDFFSGDFVIDIQDESTYLGASNMNRTDVWTLGLNDDNRIVMGELLIPYNWFNGKTYNETEDMFNLTFNGVSLDKNYFYGLTRDQSNLGSYGKYGYGVLVYDVTTLINTSGDNVLVLNKNYPTPAVYPAVLAYAYNAPRSTFKTLLYNFGADLLANSSNIAGRTVKSDSSIYFDEEDMDNVNFTLYVLAAGAQLGEGNLVFNDVEYTNVWNGTTKSTDLFVVDVTEGIVPADNNISFVATGSTILALPQYMLVDQGYYYDIDSIETEYKDTVYAGTTNTLTVTVTTDVEGEFYFDLYADSPDNLVNSTTVNLTMGTNKVFITDPTIRPIDETTVNGADNIKVTYVVILSSKFGDWVVNKNTTASVLYNGNLGYDMEYNVTGFEELFVNKKLNGDVVIDVKTESSYLGAKDMNRTDVWNIDLDEGSIIDDAYLIVPYNWFNPTLGNETEGMFDITFNGMEIVPIAHYRDQSNLGSYGKYGYGVLIYRVDNLINSSGDNTLVLNKKYETPAVYPSTLIYFYKNPNESLKVISMFMGADLLANSSNTAGRIVKSDSVIDLDNIDFEDVVLYVLAASAQKGEGNIIANGKVFEDVWSGSSKTTDLFEANITDVSADLNNISFVATGSTILALPQMIVADTGIIMSIDSVQTEYKDTCFAGTNNTLTVTVTTNKEGEYEFLLFSNLNPVSSLKVNLTNGTHTILLTDPTIRPIDESTVNGAENKKVTYNVAMDNGYYFATGDLTVPVLYNGNLGYDMEYNVTGFEGLFANKKLNGDVVIDVKNESSYLGAKDMNRTDVWNINLDEGSIIDDAYLIIPYNWFNPTLGNETDDMFDITFNGMEITPIAHYRDQSNLGGYGKYGYGVLIYGLYGSVNGSGDNTLVLNKKYETPAVYPSTLIYFYKNPKESLKVISMYIGADLLANSSNTAGRIVKSDSVIDLDYTGFDDVALYVLAASAQKGEGNIIANGKVFEDVWSGSSKTTDLFEANITDVLTDLNNISFVATGSTILALPQLIVADTGIIMSIDSVQTEYKDTCFAGTNNTLTVTVTTNKEGEYEFLLFSNFNQVDSLKVNLTNGTHTILLTDPTIRPIDESTVNGAENEKVLYDVGMFKGDYFVVDELIVPVLYNGYLGKDMEYNATYIEDITAIEFTGDFFIFGQDTSTYAAAGVTNRTDVWNVVYDENSTLVKAFVYLAYNWDKSGEAGPVFNITFNGNSIYPKAHYRDQSNLGSSGTYGYGLFVFDVTDLIKNDINTMVLNKPAGLTAVYPSSLIYMFNETDSELIKTAYFADGADLLLASSYNKAGRIVKTDSIIGVDTEDIYNPVIVVFAASAQSGEGNLIFNGVEQMDVWNGTSNSLEVYRYDMDEISNLNNVSFVATGSTILALNQIILVTRDVDAAEFKDMIVYGNASVGATLVDSYGKAIANQTITYTVNGVENTTTTNDKGEFIIQAASNSFVEIRFDGNKFMLPVNTNITLKDLAPARTATVISAEDYTTYAIDFDAGERGNYFKVQLLDEKGNPLANKDIKIGFNGIVYNRTTNATGWTELQINLKKAGAYTFAIAFLGDDEYNASFAIKLITVNKKKTSISASAKTYKVSAKTKKYTVTLKTDKGSSIDGKTYLKAGKKITIKINGKTYTAKTDSKGKATFSLKITKKGKFAATVKFAGDSMYEKSSKSVKITIK